MRLDTKITITVVALVLGTAIGMVVLTFRNLEAVILPVALENLDARVQRLTSQLDMEVQATRADVQAMDVEPGIHRVFRAHAAGGIDPIDNIPEAAARENLAAFFAHKLRAKFSYLQLQLIGADDDGRELVRVDRLGEAGAIRVVPDVDLQSTANSDYFRSTVNLREEEVYVSPIALNRKNGAIGIPHLPVLRIATPVYSPGAQLLGILVTDLDMRSYFARIREAAQSGGKIYVVNADGDYLVHPDRSHEFGFDLGARFLLKDEFPDFAHELENSALQSGVITDPQGSEWGAGLTSLLLAGGPRITIIETLPYDVIMMPAAAVRAFSLIAGSVAAVCATALAALLARSVTRPLSQLTEAVETFATEAPREVPVGATGEIGMLARAFASLAADIRRKDAAIASEIEEKRRTEASLRQLLERFSLYSAAVESSQDAIITNRLDGIITGWNPAAERLYGYTEAEAIGQHLSILAPPDRRAEIDYVLDRLRAGDRIDHLETVRISKDGRRVDVSESISAVTLPTGEIIGASAIARDISAERHAEAVRLALDSSPNAMVMADSKGYIVLVNAETERLFGYCQDELIGQAIEKLVPEQHRFAHHELRNEYEGQSPRRSTGKGTDLRAVRKDGTEFLVVVTLHPIQMRAGDFVLGVIADVSKQRESESEIVRFTEELRRSNADLEQFAYVASHDLQEPLRMVASYTELLADRYAEKLDETGVRYIHFAMDGAQRMKRLINDLLKYSRLDMSNVSLEPTNSELVLKNALHSLEKLIQESGTNVEWGDMPTVAAVETQLAQVFQNLIGNAVKFRSESAPRVRVSAQRTSDMCVFSVEDNGIGIDQRHADRVFQLFQRLHVRDKYDGNGIGLAVVKRIVERHGGRVWFESRPPSGTTFFFTLPLPREN